MNDKKIIMVPIDRIRPLNSRHRARRKFEAVRPGIKNPGLKKPIQVSWRSAGETGEADYDLVSGHGRFEAFVALGYKMIPAVGSGVRRKAGCAGILPRWN